MVMPHIDAVVLTAGMLTSGHGGRMREVFGGQVSDR